MGFIPFAATIGNITPPLPVADGGSGQVTDPLPPWMASDWAAQVQNYDPATASSTFPVTAGIQYMMRIQIREALIATNVCVAVSTAGNNTGGSAGTFVALYSANGTLLSGSADVASSLTTAGLAVLPLTTAQALSGDTFVWASILVNLGTTQPSFARTPAPVQGLNVNLATPLLRFATITGTGRTTVSPTFTPSSALTTANVQGCWTALS